MDDKLKNLKVPYLFDEDGLIRQGLSIKNYARITNASSEDELNEVILSIIEEEKQNGNQENFNGGNK